MIVKLQFRSDKDEPCDRSKICDSIVRAIDKEMGGAHWESDGTGWIAQR